MQFLRPRAPLALAVPLAALTACLLASPPRAAAPLALESKQAMVVSAQHLASDTGAAVLSELDGQDRIYLRARVRLERLDRELRAWNQGAKGAYDNVLQSLHARMQQICVKIPDKDAARGSCEAFLAAA